MEKKYEMIPEGNMFRIKALRSFGNIVAGELGGLIEKESNLSHDGKCWVSSNARVSGDAFIFGGARVSGDALVFGDARVSGDALVFGDALVSGNAEVSGNARVFGDALVSGDAIIKHAHHTKTVKTFQLSKHCITLDGEYINIGCKSMKIDEWIDKCEEVGKKEGYTQKEIEEYKTVIKMIKSLYLKN